MRAKRRTRAHLEESLYEANPQDVVRLARWLGVMPERVEEETVRSFRARCAFAVLEYEKRRRRKAAKRAKMKAART